MGILASNTRSNRASVSITPQARLDVPIKLVVTLWFLRRFGRLVVWMVRHPRAMAAGTVIAAAMYGVNASVNRFGPVLTFSGLAALVGGLCLAGYLQPALADRLVETPLRSRWRKIWVYRHAWQPAMALSGLSFSTPTDEILPELMVVRSTATVDLVRVRMLPAQTLEDYAKAAPRLAQTFSVRECRARAVPGHFQLVDLWMMTGDPLSRPVDPPVVAVTDVHAIPVGVTETGAPLKLQIAHSHLLVAGQTGSGKGSVLWAILCGLAPAIRAGTVKVWALDPKGGMELSAGEPLFNQFDFSAEGIVDSLEEVADLMQDRAERLRGRTRKMQPSKAEPLIVVVIDELAAIIAYQTNYELRRRATAAINLLLSQGRAVGVVVLAAVQDARKETVAMRDLFPTRIALRAAEAEQADMVLGRGARDRGALTDKIPTNLPGVGYAIIDDAPEPVRVRFAHIRDEDIAAVVEKFNHPQPKENTTA
jgi:S-DNA-T family DNA segregation ATPase FtsK/SpoIIIE